MKNADHTVGNNHSGKQSVAGKTGHQNEHQQRPHDGVDRGQYVGPDDFGGGAHRSVRHIVGAAVGYSLGYLGSGEPAEGRGGVHTLILGGWALVGGLFKNKALFAQGQTVTGAQYRRVGGLVTSIAFPHGHRAVVGASHVG